MTKEEISARQQQAAQFHAMGYNCAQSVACAFADKVDLDKVALFKVTEGLGLGINLPTSKDALTIDKTTGGVTSAIKVLAAWPTPPTGTAKVTAFNGSEVTLTAPNPNEYTLDAANGRALYDGKTVDQILTNK